MSVDMPKVLKVALGITGFMLAMQWAMDWDSRHRAPPPPETAQQKLDREAREWHDSRMRLAYHAQRGLKEMMRNPDSFKAEHAYVMSSGAICIQYRAQNGFGGMNRDYLVITPKNKSIGHDGALFPMAWREYCDRGTIVDDAA